MFTASFHVPFAIPLCVLAMSECGWTDSPPDVLGEEPAEVAMRFSSGPSSLDELARGIVLTAAASDTAALSAFRLTEREHEERVWPETPIARQDGPEFPHALAWENIEIRNAAGMARLLSRLGGRSVEYRGVDCAGPEERHDSYVVLTDCRVEIADSERGVERLQIFRSVVVGDGVYKVIRYEREHG